MGQEVQAHSPGFKPTGSAGAVPEVKFLLTAQRLWPCVIGVLCRHRAGRRRSHLVPLVLLLLDRTHNHIRMLEPCRLAVRAVAERMAGTPGEPVGDHIARCGKGIRRFPGPQ